MTSTIAVNGSAVASVASPSHTDWVALARELGPGFAARAAAHDANDSFPEENYRELKEHRFFSAGVPAELGGGGASHRELCAMLRELGRHCGATALALSMHTHLVGTTVWLWRQGAPVGAAARTHRRGTAGAGHQWCLRLAGLERRGRTRRRRLSSHRSQDLQQRFTDG